MGFSHSLVAVAGLTPEEVAARLDRAPSDETTTYDVASSRAAPGLCVSAPIDGWTFVVDQKREITAGDGGVLARLSGGTRLLTFDVEEHVMAIWTTCWTDGAYAWEVIGDERLFVIGDPPPPFGELVAELREGPDVIYALNELTGPPEEAWEELGFDPSSMPSVRAAAFGLAVREADPAPEFALHRYKPAEVIFTRLTGHRYDGGDALHHASLRVLRAAA